MREFAAIKIKRFHYIIFAVFLAFICFEKDVYLNRISKSYYNIHVFDYEIAEGLKMEMPLISYGEDLPTFTRLMIVRFWVEHEIVCQYVKENYRSCDITLDIDINHHQTILKYGGSAVDLHDKYIVFKKSIVFDFAFDEHNISYKR